MSSIVQVVNSSIFLFHIYKELWMILLLLLAMCWLKLYFEKLKEEEEIQATMKKYNTKSWQKLTVDAIWGASEMTPPRVAQRLTVRV